MTNHRLRNAMAAAELTNARLAEQVGVDAKSVERWVTQGRQPHADDPRASGASAGVRGDLPVAGSPHLIERGLGASQSELVQLWPTRNEVPADVWRTLISQAERTDGDLVYAGGFLVETFGLVDVVREKSELGARSASCSATHRCEAVRARGVEEGLPTLPQRCQSTLEYLSETLSPPGRRSPNAPAPRCTPASSGSTTPCSSTPTPTGPGRRGPRVQHLQHVPGGQLFAYYDDTFERVWATGRTVR